MCLHIYIYIYTVVFLFQKSGVIDSFLGIFLYTLWPMGLQCLSLPFLIFPFCASCPYPETCFWHWVNRQTTEIKSSMSFWLLWNNLMLPVCRQTIVFYPFQCESIVCLHFNISCYSKRKNRLAFRDDKYTAHLKPLPSPCSWCMLLTARGTPAAPWCDYRIILGTVLIGGH